MNLKARFYSIEFLRIQIPTKCFLRPGASNAGVEESLSLCQWADLRCSFFERNSNSGDELEEKKRIISEHG